LTYPDSNRAFKALIAAQFSGVSIDVAKDFVFGETNKSAQFIKKFPLGKVPALETSEGGLWESNAIAYYVANAELRGKSTWEAAQVVQWMSFADNECVHAVSSWVFPTIGVLSQNDKQVLEKGREDTKKLLTLLNDYLLTRTYLVGERISLADITVACTLLPAYQYVLEPSVRSAYGNVNRWFNTLINQTQFKKVLGTVKLCEKAGVVEVKAAAPASDKKKKEKPAPKKAEEDDLEPEDDSLEPKSKDPFEAFPKGSFNMDDFKRFYSNNPEEKSIPYFWEKFDKENYSIWQCEYKYADELTMVFMSCNLISGMFQRLDKMRKNAFGSMILFGEDNKSTISGIWVWRGHELAFPLSPDWQIDYESYDWKKLDPNDAKTKKLVGEYFSWSGDFDGKKFNQGKIFK